MQIRNKTKYRTQDMSKIITAVNKRMGVITPRKKKRLIVRFLTHKMKIFVFEDFGIFMNQRSERDYFQPN